MVPTVPISVAWSTRCPAETSTLFMWAYRLDLTVAVVDDDVLPVAGRPRGLGGGDRAGRGGDDRVAASSVRFQSTARALGLCEARVLPVQVCPQGNGIS